MLDEAAGQVRVAVVDEVVVVVSASDEGALPGEGDGVGSGSGLVHSEVTTGRGRSLQWGKNH